MHNPFDTDDELGELRHEILNAPFDHEEIAMQTDKAWIAHGRLPDGRTPEQRAYSRRVNQMDAVAAIAEDTILDIDRKEPIIGIHKGTDKTRSQIADWLNRIARRIRPRDDIPF